MTQKIIFLFLKLLVPEIICKIVIKFKIDTEGKTHFCGIRKSNTKH